MGVHCLYNIPLGIYFTLMENLKMDGSSKKCGSCCSFRAYYTKGYCNLKKENNGYCCRQEKIVSKTEYCDDWRRKHMSSVRRLAIVIKSIPIIYDKIAVVEQILKEGLDCRYSDEEKQ